MGRRRRQVDRQLLWEAFVVCSSEMTKRFGAQSKVPKACLGVFGTRARARAALGDILERVVSATGSVRPSSRTNAVGLHAVVSHEHARHRA